MKQVYLLGNKRLEIREVPIPEVKEGWVLVRLHSIPICGSDLKSFVAAKEPGATGHEGAGEVVASGSDRFKVGDRVIVPTLGGCGRCETCQSGDYIHCTSPKKDLPTPTQAEYTLAPAWLTLPVPEELDYNQASLAGCALAPAFGALRKIDVSPGRWIMVTGVGPVGLGATFIAKRMGLKVLAVDRQPSRLELALKVGAAAALGPDDPQGLEGVLGKTGGRRPVAVIECSGAAPAQRLAFDSVATGGTIAFIGASAQELSIITWNDFIQRGVTAFGQWHATMGQLHELLDFIVEYRDEVGVLISHCLPLEEAAEAYRLVTEQGAAKVILNPRVR